MNIFNGLIVLFIHNAAAESFLRTIISLKSVSLQLVCEYWSSVD